MGPIAAAGTKCPPPGQLEQPGEDQPTKPVKRAIAHNISAQTPIPIGTDGRAHQAGGRIGRSAVADAVLEGSAPLGSAYRMIGLNSVGHVLPTEGSATS